MKGCLIALAVVLIIIVLIVVGLGVYIFAFEKAVEGALRLKEAGQA